MRGFNKKHPRGWKALALLTLSALAAAGVMAAMALASGNTISWNGVNGRGSCNVGTTGTMLWIFNPHSNAVPSDMTITWQNGETDTYPASGWINPGGSQNWHLTVTIVGGFPPQSAVLNYSGTLGKSPILTISGCNEGAPPTPPVTTTTTIITTPGSTETVTVTTPGQTTTNTVTTTKTVTTPSKPKPPKHHKKPHVPKKHHKHVPAPPVQGFTR